MKNDKFKIGLDAVKLCFTDERENVLFERLLNGSNILWREMRLIFIHFG